jgi:hypothetical protein
VVIKTPADVWLAVAKGEMDGQQAFMNGRYKVVRGPKPAVKAESTVFKIEEIPISFLKREAEYFLLLLCILPTVIVDFQSNLGVNIAGEIKDFFLFSMKAYDHRLYQILQTFCTSTVSFDKISILLYFDII